MRSRYTKLLMRNRFENEFVGFFYVVTFTVNFNFQNIKCRKNMSYCFLKKQQFFTNTSFLYGFTISLQQIER